MILFLFFILCGSSWCFPVDPDSINVVPQKGSSTLTRFTLECKFIETLDSASVVFQNEEINLQNPTQYTCDVSFGTDLIGIADITQSIENENGSPILYQLHQLDISIPYTHLQMSLANVAKLDQTENPSGDGIIFFEGTNTDFTASDDTTVSVCEDRRLTLVEDKDNTISSREYSVLGQINTQSEDKTMSLELKLIILLQSAEDTKFNGMLKYGLNGCKAEDSVCCGELLKLFKVEDMIANKENPNAAPDTKTILPYVGIGVAALLLVISLSVYLYTKTKELKLNRRYTAIINKELLK